MARAGRWVPLRWARGPGSSAVRRVAWGSLGGGMARGPGRRGPKCRRGPPAGPPSSAGAAAPPASVAREGRTVRRGGPRAGPGLRAGRPAERRPAPLPVRRPGPAGHSGSAGAAPLPEVRARPARRPRPARPRLVAPVPPPPFRGVSQNRSETRSPRLSHRPGAASRPEGLAPRCRPRAGAGPAPPIRIAPAPARPQVGTAPQRPAQVDDGSRWRQWEVPGVSVVHRPGQERG